MGSINTTGYFRGTIIDGGLSQSSGDLPQEVWALKATEIWDEENNEYLSADDEHDEITAYLILINHDDKENLNAPQVKKITGWDGASLVDLQGMDLAGISLSWRVEYGKGDYSEVLGVQWVAESDASPTRTVSKISKEDAQVLQARYASVLAATKTPVQAVSAQKKATKKATKKVTKKATTPAIPKSTTPVVGKCTDQEAYDAVYALSGATEGSQAEDDLNQRWQNVVATYGPDEAMITPEQWFEIKTVLTGVKYD